MKIENRRADLLKCLASIDLTSLKSTDTPSSIRAFTEKVNEQEKQHSELPLPASICVFPNFAETVRQALKPEAVHVTVVSGCFPDSQSYLEVKELETRMALEKGADEVDIVLALNAFLEGRYDTCTSEIQVIRKICTDYGKKAQKPVLLKVILETGALKDEQDIRKAAFIAMEAGADFIKTSTGKIETGATPEAAQIMCQSIREYYQRTGRKIGFKAAGGIAEAEDALVYLDIVREILGEEWLCPALFRIGASRLQAKIIRLL